MPINPLTIQRRMNKLFYLLCSLWLLGGCEYPVGENFIERKPLPDNLPFSVDLSAQTDGHTLYIQEDGTLHYSFSADKKRFRKVTFRLGDEKWISELPHGSIDFPKDKFPVGEYTLMSEVVIESGSGSIADQVGAELYQSKVEWPVIIKKEQDLLPILQSRINEEGYLELYWNKPVFSHLKLVSFRLEIEREYEQRNIDIPKTETSYVDKEYVGDAQKYSLWMNLEYEIKDHISWMAGTLKQERAFRFNIPYKDINGQLVSWVNPCKNHLALRVNGGELFTPAEVDTAIWIPYEGFGSRRQFPRIEAQLSPYDSPEQVKYYSYLDLDFMGKQLTKDMYGCFTYHQLTDQVYCFTRDSISSFALPDFQRRETSFIRKDYYSNVLYPSDKSTKIARVCNNYQREVDIYDANQLKILKNLSPPENCYVLATNNEHLLFIEDAYNGNFKVDVYNWEGIHVGNFTFPFHGSADYLKVSRTGDFLLAKDWNEGVKVIRLKDYQIVSIKNYPGISINDTYWFNPLDNHELYIETEGKIYVKSIEDGTDIRSFNIDTDMKINDIDLYTGNILMSSYETIKVLSPEGRVLFNTKNYADKLHLINNVLISEGDGYVLNLANYINR